MYLQRGSIKAFSILPFRLTEATFNVHLFALGQVLTRDLSQAPPKCHSEPRCQILRFSGLILPSLGGCDGEIANGGTLGRIPELGVSPKISDNGDLVE